MDSPLFFDRTLSLMGSKGMELLLTKRVLLFGVGGVGSWCAEALVRTGIRHLTLVDCDKVCPTNINRQLMATTHSLGQPKVEALRERLMAINPDTDIRISEEMYTSGTAESFHLEQYDYVIDAIDSLQDKCHLILHATSLPVTFFSSMGAALKLDPAHIHVTEFWNVKGCPLARAIRNRFKREHTFPTHKFQCVYSDEPHTETRQDMHTQDGSMTFGKAKTNGSLCHITGIFGLTLAGLVIQDIHRLAEVAMASTTDGHIPEDDH